VYSRKVPEAEKQGEKATETPKTERRFVFSLFINLLPLALKSQVNMGAQFAIDIKGRQACREKPERRYRLQINIHREIPLVEEMADPDWNPSAENDGVLNQQVPAYSNVKRRLVAQVEVMP